MPGHDITISGRDGDFSAYLAAPARGEGPGVVVIQEIFGVNAVMRAIADDLGSLGYFALAPDLFWRLKPGVQLTDRTDAEWRRALALMQRFDIDKGVEDIQSAIDHLRVTPGASGKVGTVGYCLGGQLAYLAAARSDCDASVGYYGVMLQDRLAEAANITAPLMLHIAGEDEFTPPPARDKVIAGLKDNPHVTMHVYPGMGHAFARPDGAHYDKAAADLANARTRDFFRAHLS